MDNTTRTQFDEDKALEIVVRVALESGQTLVNELNKDKEIYLKGRTDLVSNVDKMVEEQIIDALTNSFPGYGIIAEESSPRPTETGFTWVIDPLDGTRNYIRGIPFFSLVIALTFGDQVVLGVTYDPIRQELFHAIKGKGAYLNNESMIVSNKDRLSEALIGYDLGYVDDKAGQAIEMISDLWPGLQSTRMMGSAALGLAYAACGRTDIYFHPHLSAWDLASGLLLVEEAGGIVTDKHGYSAGLFSGSVIAGGRKTHGTFLEETQGAAWRLE